MKKILALVLTFAVCLSLCACGGEKDTASAEGSIQTSGTITENETTTTPDYASELTDILCSGKWVSEVYGEELMFNANGTLSLISEDGSKEATWRYHSYYASSADLPFPISAVLSEDFCAYWGKVGGEEYIGGFDIVVGYNEEGALVMSFSGTSWIREA